MRRADAACLEAEDQLALGAPSEEAARRVEIHLRHCPSCRARADAVSAVASVVVEAAGPPLDELTRARVAARLQAEMDAVASSLARPPRALRWDRRPLLAAAALIVAVLGAYLYSLRLGGGGSRALLTPYVTAGTAARGGSAYASLGQGLERLQVSAGGLVRASIGDQGRLTLLGPALLEVRQVSGQEIVLELSQGTLIGEWEHGRGAALRVLSRGLSATVIGTRFLIRCPEVGDATLAVAEGIVDVESASGRSRIGAGAANDRPSMHESDARLLAEEAAALGPPVGGRPAGIVVLAGTPPGAAVRAGGSLIGPAPVAAVLSAGHAELEASASGFVPAIKEAEVRPGAVATLGFALEPVPPVSPPPAAPAPPASPSPKAVARAPVSASPEVPGERLQLSAEALYRQAEAALRDGDRPLARERLELILRWYPSDPSVEPALYDLARIAYEEGDTTGAKDAVERLLARGQDVAMREAASYLRCRLALGQTEDGRWLAEVVACFRDFRRDFPASTHDPEVLLLLATAWARAGRCDTARPLLAEYLDRYRDLEGAATARQWKDRCDP